MMHGAMPVLGPPFLLRDYLGLFSLAVLCSGHNTVDGAGHRGPLDCGCYGMLTAQPFTVTSPPIPVKK